jgi:hypothetical protein
VAPCHADHLAAQVGKGQLSLGLLFCYTQNMKRPAKLTPKKKRGRPATGRDPHVTSRMPRRLIERVEAWAAAHAIGRSEAIRRLVEQGLTVEMKAMPAQRSRAARAAELATKAIEKMIDPAAAPPEERARRRRRLTRGPSEFLEDRVDQPKARRK